MISGFNRSISLPLSSRKKAGAVYHVRSVSLPSRSHPLISNLEEKIQAVLSWAASSNFSIAWLETGLSHIELLHLALNDFFGLSDIKNVLQCETTSIEQFLDDLLNLVDSYGSFLSVLVSLKQQLFEVQSALRRNDSNLLTSSLKAQRRTEKELSRITACLCTTTKCSPLEHDILLILKEAICATSAASVAVINRVISVSTVASTAAVSSASSRNMLFTKKCSKEEREIVASEKLKELEKCIEIVQCGSEKVFRNLVNSRVLLLNIQSHSF